MRFISLFAASLTAALGVSASIFDRKSEALEARGSFGEANPLSLVYNGQQNVMTISLLNHGKTDLSINAITGAIREVGGKERHLANTTTAKYSLVLPANSVAPVDVPYRFYSELKPQDVGFVVYVDYSDATDLKKTTLRTVAYDGSATIREPAGSWFDLQLLFLYPLVLALIGAPLYFLYTIFIGPALFPKKAPAARKRRNSATAVVAKSPTPRPSTPSDPNEWIPAHHLTKRRTVSGRNLVTLGNGGVTPVNATSDESGNESASTPRRSTRSSKGKGKGKAQ